MSESRKTTTICAMVTKNYTFFNSYYRELQLFRPQVAEKYNFNNFRSGVVVSPPYQSDDDILLSTLVAGPMPKHMLMVFNSSSWSSYVAE